MAVLASKICVSPLVAPVIARAQLLARLDNAVRAPPTLLVAPSGYGKTTALSEPLLAGMPEVITLWAKRGTA